MADPGTNAGASSVGVHEAQLQIGSVLPCVRRDKPTPEMGRRHQSNHFTKMFSKFLIGALLCFAALLLLPSSFVQTFFAAASIAALGVAVAARCKGSPAKRLLFGFSAMIALSIGALWMHFSGPAFVGSMAIAGATLTQDQVDEFTSIMRGLSDYADLFPKIRDMARMEGGLETLKSIPAIIRAMQNEIKTLRKTSLANGTAGVRWVGGIPFVTDDCAEALTATFILEVERLGGTALESLMKDSDNRQRMVSKSRNILGAVTRASLTTTEIPVPTIYAPQIVELVWKYGQARQYATVFPLGAGTVKLPRLKAGEDDFGYLGAGTAGMSQSVTERKVTAELITFTANKAGGLIRIPYELEEDTFIPVGQFLARYIARQLAKLEDKTLFLADGTGTYASIIGVGQYCTNTPNYLQQLAGGKTKPSDATLTDFRAMRGLINAAAYNNGAYYMNPTMDALLVTFNTLGQPLIYQRRPDGTATLDGFPVRWIGVSQAYATTATPGAYLAFFGDLSYIYLGERGTPRVEVSREVFFTTDELAMRALERIDVEIMAVDAMSSLKTAAS